MLIMKGVRPPVGEIYSATEAANGELGFYLITDGSRTPYRLKFRRPCYIYYQAYTEMIKGGMLLEDTALGFGLGQLIKMPNKIASASVICEK